MAPPSKLAIATSSLNRLVKEDASYYKEHEDQKARIAKLEQGSSDENAEYTLRQERKALEETEAMFPQMKQKIQEALKNLETQLEQNNSSKDQNSSEDITKAKEAIDSAMTAIRDTS